MLNQKKGFKVEDGNEEARKVRRRKLWMASATKAHDRLSRTWKEEILDNIACKPTIQTKNASNKTQQK